jgi:gluconate 2-dehydrogenase gamma chain
MTTSDEPDLPRFFTDDQRAVVQAMMARIIPSDDGPGATEAGAIEFLERYLSGVDYIYAKPDGSGFETLTGRKLEAWTKRVAAVRKTYRDGIAEVDRLSQARFGDRFASLHAGDQDDVLRHIEQHGTSGANTLDEAQADISGAVSVEIELQMSRQDDEFEFFPLVITHTRQGFYSDPIYGGNRDHLGWKWIGFPGPESMAEVHAGRFTTVEWFATNLNHPEEKLGSK